MIPKDAPWDGTVLRPLAFRQNPIEPWYVTLESAVWKSAEIASGNGHGNARGVARIYGALANRRRAVRRAPDVQGGHRGHEYRAAQPDRADAGTSYHQALGVLLNTAAAVYMGPNRRSFGHHGIGGSIGFADPDAGIGFGYACNKMHAVGDNGPRARRLIDASPPPRSSPSTDPHR